MALRPHLISFRHVKDERGNLSFTEFQKDIPFDVKRTYWISEMPEHQKRGGHAHRTDIQLIVCAQGKATVRLESINQDVLTFELQTSEQGLVIPPLWWGTMEFSDHAVLLGFASADFNEQDYIRNKADFR